VMVRVIERRRWRR